MPFPQNLPFDDMRLQFGANCRCAIDAHADEAHATRCKAFEGRYSDLGGITFCENFALAHGQQNYATHGLMPRLAAASASLALE